MIISCYRHSNDIKRDHHNNHECHYHACSNLLLSFRNSVICRGRAQLQQMEEHACAHGQGSLCRGYCAGLPAEQGQQGLGVHRQALGVPQPQAPAPPMGPPCCRPLQCHHSWFVLPTRCITTICLAPLVQAADCTKPHGNCCENLQAESLAFCCSFDRCLP